MILTRDARVLGTGRMRLYPTVVPVAILCQAPSCSDHGHARAGSDQLLREPRVEIGRGRI